MIAGAARWMRIAEVRVRRWGAAVAGTFVLALLLPGAVLVSTGSEASAVRSSALVLLWGGYGLALLLGSGGWTAQRRSGSLLLWLQKPVSPVLLHLGRIPPRVMVTSLAILLVTGVSMTFSAVLEGPAGVGEMWTAGCTMIVTGAVLVCMIQGVSGVGLPREELFGLTAYLGLSLLEWTAFDRPEAYGPLLPLVRAVGVPVDGIGYTGQLLGGGVVDDPAGHVLSVALYTVGWVAVGAAGVALTPHPAFGARDE